MLLWRAVILWSKSCWTEFLWASLLAWTFDILSFPAVSSVLHHSALPDKSSSFSSGFNDLYYSALFVFVQNWESSTMLLSFVFVQHPVIYTKLLCETKDFVFLQNQVIYTKLLCETKDFVSLQNQVIYTNLLIWTKAFLFLRDPVIYITQLCEKKAFLFSRIQWLVPYCSIRQNFFFSAGSICCIAFFFPFCM